MKSVLVLMSVYNGKTYVKQQIDSILSQKSVEVHILVRDDCSKDETINILKEYNDDRIEIVTGQNQGFAESFSTLLKLASEKKIYDYYAFADQDDVWMDDKLISAITKLSRIEEPNIPCGYCSNSTLVDSNLKFMRLMHNREVKLTKERALIQNIATGCTMLFNYSAVKYYVDYRPEKIVVHDYLMYLICMYLGQFVYDPESHIKYRQHSNNQIGSKSWISRMKRRIAKFGASNGYFENQSKAFLESYKHILSINDVLSISYLCNYRKSMSSKIALLFDNKYKYDNLEFNIFMCLKILLGKL